MNYESHIQGLLDDGVKVLSHLGAFTLIPPGHQGELTSVDAVIAPHHPLQLMECRKVNDYYTIAPKGQSLVTGRRYKLMIPAS